MLVKEFGEKLNREFTDQGDLSIQMKKADDQKPKSPSLYNLGLTAT